jgi:two-component system, chemotaxis family, sensor kinase CheA
MSHNQTIEEIQKRIAELEREKQMFDGLLATIPDKIYFKDTKSRFIRVSFDMKKTIFKSDNDKYIGKTDFDYFTEEHARPAYEGEQEIIRTGKPLINLEEKETFGDGSFSWVSTTKVPIRDDENRITGIVGISRDITAQKRVEEQRQQYRGRLEIVKNETDNILKNVEEGFFLIDNKYKIASQYSLELKNILGERQLANRDFLKVLLKKIEPEIIVLLKDYLNMLFDLKYTFELIKELNPLVEIKTIINDEIKYLTFNFKRILNNNKVEQLIVTVEDMTKEVGLAQSLQEEKEESKRNLEWLLLILNVEPGMLDEFVNSYEYELSAIKKATKHITSANKDVELNVISRSIHSIKGNASLLEISFLVDAMHRIEDSIIFYKNKKKLSLVDIKAIKDHYDFVRKMYDELIKLIKQIEGINKRLGEGKRYDPQAFVKSLKRLAVSMAHEYNKQADFDYSEFSADLIPENHRLLVRDALVQLVRNAMRHGIETREKREKQGKNGIGHIKISGYSREKDYFLVLEDDGQGIDNQKVAEALTHCGKCSVEEVARMDQQQLTEAIFIPGVSTVFDADKNAGRGMGMDIIKKKIEKIGGNISIVTQPGLFTRFTVTIPYEHKPINMN